MANYFGNYTSFEKIYYQNNLKWCKRAKHPGRESFKDLSKRPKKVLVDNRTQFKEQFERFCKWNKVEVEHTPKHYPQSKGKIERNIRTQNEEYIRMDKVFEKPSLFIDKLVVSEE